MGDYSNIARVRLPSFVHNYVQRGHVEGQAKSKFRQNWFKFQRELLHPSTIRNAFQFVSVAILIKQIQESFD